VLLFNDLVLCASMRRRSSFRRNTNSLTSMQPDFSSMRYKYLWQAPIAVCTLSKVQPSPSIRRSRGNVSRQLEQLQQDMGTLHKLIDISKQLKYDHQPLDLVLRDMLAGLKEDIEERKDAQEQSIFNLETSRVNLLVHANRPPTQYPLVFMDPGVKQDWESEFIEAKKTAELKMKNRRVASLRSSSAWLTLNSLEFLNPLPLQPGRMGMKLTCAGIGLSTVRGSPHSMWICRGDEYGGQVCLLNMERTTKPRLVSSITVCNSEITCISFVPCGPSDHTHPLTPTRPRSPGRQTESEMNILDEFLNSVQKSHKEHKLERVEPHKDHTHEQAELHKDHTHERAELQRQTVPEFGSQDSISTLIPIEVPRSPTPPYSPSFRKKMTTSPLALHQVSSSPKMRRHKSTSPTSMQAEIYPKHTRSHSDTSPLFAPKQYTHAHLPPHKEEMDSDTDTEDNTPSDNLFSPEEHKSFTFSSSLVKKPEFADILKEGPRIRSLSAPPDPDQVLGKKSGHKSVTIVENLEERSSSQEDNLPKRTSSESDTSSPAKRPFSPLTLKPISADEEQFGKGQVWLGTGEGV
jgi:hypothetical protein